MILSVYDDKHEGNVAFFKIDAVLPMKGEALRLKGLDDVAVSAWFPVKLEGAENWTRLWISPKTQRLRVDGENVPMEWWISGDAEYFEERYTRMTNEGWDEVTV